MISEHGIHISLRTTRLLYGKEKQAHISLNTFI